MPGTRTEHFFACQQSNPDLHSHNHYIHRLSSAHQECVNKYIYNRRWYRQYLYNATVFEICPLLSCSAEYCGKFLPTFRTTYRSHLQGSKVKVVPKYHYRLRNNPEELTSHLLCDESLKSVQLFLFTLSNQLQPLRERERVVYLWVPPSVPQLRGTPEARGGLRGGVEHDLVLLAAIDCPTPVYGA